MVGGLEKVTSSVSWRADGDLLTTGKEENFKIHMSAEGKVGPGKVGPGNGDLVIWLLRDLMFPNFRHGCCCCCCC